MVEKNRTEKNTIRPSYYMFESAMKSIKLILNLVLLARKFKLFHPTQICGTLIIYKTVKKGDPSTLMHTVTFPCWFRTEEMYSNIATMCLTVLKVRASAVAAVRLVVIPWTSCGSAAFTAAASGHAWRFVLALKYAMDWATKSRCPWLGSFVK